MPSQSQTFQKKTALWFRKLDRTQQVSLSAYKHTKNEWPETRGILSTSTARCRLPYTLKTENSLYYGCDRLHRTLHRQRNTLCWCHRFGLLLQNFRGTSHHNLARKTGRQPMPCAQLDSRVDQTYSLYLGSIRPLPKTFTGAGM